MPPSWQFLLYRGVNFRTKRGLATIGLSTVYQLADVGLTGLATDPDIFAEVQRRRLILITKDTDFIRDIRYALGHDDIHYVIQSRTEIADTTTAMLDLANQYSVLTNMRFVIRAGGAFSRVS